MIDQEKLTKIDGFDMAEETRNLSGSQALAMIKKSLFAATKAGSDDSMAHVQRAYHLCCEIDKRFCDDGENDEIELPENMISLIEKSVEGIDDIVQSTSSVVKLIEKRFRVDTEKSEEAQSQNSQPEAVQKAQKHDKDDELTADFTCADLNSENIDVSNVTW